jgi:DNA replication and repair protein RecF
VRLAWIHIRDFRNYREAEVEVPAGLVAVVGPNGQGKTNLLEAMDYLCALESPRVRADLPLVRVGASSAFLRGEVETGSGRLLIEVEIRVTGQNRVQVNRSPVRRKRDLRRQARAVFSGPDDLHVVEGDPDERRRFMDEASRSLWPLKEGVPAAYERVLRQRNRLLKDWEGAGAPPDLGAWDGELVEHGTALTSLRGEAVAALSEAAGRWFEDLSGDPLLVGYRPSVEGEDLAAVFRARLAERRPDELVRRTTLVGPHRDDLGLAVDDLAARGFASHGESWAAAVCLRLGLAEAVEGEAGEPPMLFLDDPFSGLDPARRAKLAAGVAAGAGARGPRQVLLAVPDEAQVPVGAQVWRVQEGTVAVA